MARRVRSLRELRQEHEAAVARGLVPEVESPKRASSGARAPVERKRAMAPAKMKMVWKVCDQAGRSLATYEYAAKADAEAHIERLRAQGKGKHFLRAEKVPME